MYKLKYSIHSEVFPVIPQPSVIVDHGNHSDPKLRDTKGSNKTQSRLNTICTPGHAKAVKANAKSMDFGRCPNDRFECRVTLPKRLNYTPECPVHDGKYK